jgi:hypothetical protein
VHTRQALYYSSYVSSLVFVVLFCFALLCFMFDTESHSEAAGWPLTCEPSACTSCVAGIRGMPYHARLRHEYFFKNSKGLWDSSSRMSA